MKPRRLREAVAKDVTEWLRLLAGQPDTGVWKLRQAEKALRVFPSEKLAVDPRGGKVRRHHIDPSTLQRAVAWVE